MALIEKKITDSERDAVQVKSIEGSRLAGSVSENKNVFDKFPQLIMDKFNALVELLSTLGLENIADNFADRYTKKEVDDITGEIKTQVDTATKDVVRKIRLNGVEVPEESDGTVELWITAEGGDMQLYATKAYVTDEIKVNGVIVNGTRVKPDGEKYVNIAVPEIYVENFELPSDAWTFDEGINAYVLMVENEAVTANHIVSINLDLASLEVAANCGLKAVTESYDGGFYIYADSSPVAALTGTMVVVGAAVLPSSGSNVVPMNALAGVDGVYLTVKEE